MIADTLGTPILQFDLFQEIQSLHKEEAWLQGAGPSSKTLVKHPDLRVVLLAMKKNTVMKEHSTAARICRLWSVTSACGYQVARWTYHRGSCLSWISAFPMMLKPRKTAPSCSPSRGKLRALKLVRRMCRSKRALLNLG